MQRTRLPLRQALGFVVVIAGCSQESPNFVPNSGQVPDSGRGPATVMTSDAGTYATAHTPNAVACIDRVCNTANTVCCGTATFDPPIDRPEGGTISVPWNGGYVASCPPAASEACDLKMTCDGPEDCPAGQSCCIAEQAGWYFKSTCAPECVAGIADAPDIWFGLCHDHTDCPSDFPACCTWSHSAAAPSTYGICYALAIIATPTQAPVVCDVP